MMRASQNWRARGFQNLIKAPLARQLNLEAMREREFAQASLEGERLEIESHCRYQRVHQDRDIRELSGNEACAVSEAIRERR